MSNVVYSFKLKTNIRAVKAVCKIDWFAKFIRDENANPFNLISFDWKERWVDGLFKFWSGMIGGNLRNVYYFAKRILTNQLIFNNTLTGKRLRELPFKV